MRLRPTTLGPLPAKVLLQARSKFRHDVWTPGSTESLAGDATPIAEEGIPDGDAAAATLEEHSEVHSSYQMVGVWTRQKKTAGHKRRSSEWHRPRKASGALPDDLPEIWLPMVDVFRTPGCSVPVPLEHQRSPS